MGEVPSWYPLLQAAKYLGVAPWELATKPQWWTSIALAAEAAETGAQKDRDKKKKPGR